MACSSASRLRARSWAKRSLRHTIRRSPGYASQRISARSVSSNIERCTAPELISSRIAGARTALIQSSPAGATSSRMRASVSIPRSPTSTTRERGEALAQLLDVDTDGVGVGGVAVEHLDGDRTPVVSHIHRLHQVANRITCSITWLHIPKKLTA